MEKKEDLKHKKRNNMISLNFEINATYNVANRVLNYTTNAFPIIQSINFKKCRIQCSMKSFYPK